MPRGAVDTACCRREVEEKYRFSDEFLVNKQTIKILVNIVIALCF